MNKLLFSEGGQPLFLDDIEFMQQSTHDMITALASPYGNVILHGCYVSTDGHNVTRWGKGAMVINGEIYNVDEGEARFSTTDKDKLYFKVVKETTSRMFQNNTTQAIYEIGKVVVAEVIGSGDIAVKVSKMKTFKDRLVDIVGGSFVPSKRDYTSMYVGAGKVQYNGAMLNLDYTYFGGIKIVLNTEMRTSEVSEEFSEYNQEAKAAKSQGKAIPFRSLMTIEVYQGVARHINAIPMCHLSADGKVTWYSAYLQRISNARYELAFRVGTGGDITIPAGELFANIFIPPAPSRIQLDAPTGGHVGAIIR